MSVAVLQYCSYTVSACTNVTHRFMVCVLLAAAVVTRTRGDVLYTRYTYRKVMYGTKVPVSTFSQAVQYCKDKNSTLLTYEDVNEFLDVVASPYFNSTSSGSSTTAIDTTPWSTNSSFPAVAYGSTLGYLGLQYNRVTGLYAWADGKHRPAFLDSVLVDLSQCSYNTDAYMLGSIAGSRPVLCCARADLAYDARGWHLGDNGYSMQTGKKFKLSFVPCTRQGFATIYCKADPTGPRPPPPPSPPASPPPPPSPDYRPIPEGALVVAR